MGCSATPCQARLRLPNGLEQYPTANKECPIFKFVPGFFLVGYWIFSSFPSSARNPEAPTDSRHLSHPAIPVAIPIAGGYPEGRYERFES